MCRYVGAFAIVGSIFLAWMCRRVDLFWNRGRSIPLGTAFSKAGFSIADMPDLSGKVALVTGANTGLGHETALQLALANATVWLGCRDAAKGDAAAEQISTAVKNRGGLGQARAFQLDLADLTQVQSAAKKLLTELPALHILVNNAGVATQFPHTLTKDGLEATFQVNYLGHFLLTERLLPLLERSSQSGAPSRVVHLSSGAHRGAPQEGVPLSKAGVNDAAAYGGYARYGMAKLANIALARELHRRSFSKGVLSNAVHPGVVATDMLRPANFQAMLGKKLGAVVLGLARTRNYFFAYSPRQAALTVLYCAAAPELAEHSTHGKLYVPIATPWSARHPKAEDPVFWAALWNFSENLVEDALRLRYDPGISQHT